MNIFTSIAGGLLIGWVSGTAYGFPIALIPILIWALLVAVDE